MKGLIDRLKRGAKNIGLKPVTFNEDMFDRSWNDYLTNPLGKSLGKGPAGKFWDTHIGREGLIGAIGDFTGLWESGTTADKRRDALDANQNYIDDLMQKKEDALPNALDRMNFRNLANASQMEGLLGGINSGGLATDNSRTLETNNLIANAIARRNADFKDTMENVRNKRDTYDDNLFLAEQRKEDLS